MNDTKHKAPGQLAYAAPDTDPKALEAFFRGLDSERRWFAYRPRAKKFRRELSKGERVRLGYPLGSELVGHRLSNGRVAWFVSYPKPAGGGAGERPTGETQLRDIATAVVKSMNNVQAQPVGGVPASPTSNMLAAGPAQTIEPAVGTTPKPGTGNTPSAHGTDIVEPTSPSPAAFAAPAPAATHGSKALGT